MAGFHRAVSDALDRWWSEVCKKVNKSVVFLDVAAAECLHWHGGLLQLLNSGAVNVKDFSSFQSEKNQNKAVFVLTKPISGQSLNIIKDIITSSNFSYCLVITSSPPDVHTLVKRNSGIDDKQIFNVIEEQLIEYMGSLSCTAEVLCIPIFAVGICPWLYIMPAFSNLFPLCCDKEDQFSTSSQLKKGGAQDGGFASLPDNMKIEVRSLTHCLNRLLEQIGVKEDIFSLGHLSHIIGNELENLAEAKTRRKNVLKKASLLLVDRTLDLAGPLSQDMDSLLDRILRVLTHLPGHTCDVAVDMTPLTSCKGGEVFDNPIVAPGCLAHKQNSITLALLEELVMSKQKACFMEVNRKVIEVATKEGLPVEVSGRTARLTPELLGKHVVAFKDKPEVFVKHIGLLQQALAVVNTLQHPVSKKLDELLSTEKLLIQNMASVEDSVCQNIMQIIAHRKERSQTLEDIVILIGFLCALGGGEILFQQDTKAELQAALVEAVFQDAEELPQFLKDLVGESVDETSVIYAVNKIFNRLEVIGTNRDHLKKYRSLFHSGNPALPAVYTPFLRQIVEDILKPTYKEMIDIEYHSSGFTDLLKSGFSLFINVSKPLPRDNPLLIIIVLGGITATEVKHIKDAASNSKSVEVIIVATRLLTPVDVVQKIFCDINFQDE